MTDNKNTQKKRTTSYKSGGNPTQRPGVKQPPKGKDIPRLLFRRAYKKTRLFLKNAGNNINLGTLNSYRSIIFSIVAVVLIAAVFVTIWALTNKNARRVSVGGTPIGIVKINKNVTEQTLTDTIITKLSNDIGMSVRLNETISFELLHASGKNMITDENLISLLAKAFTYQVEATVITVDNVEMALLKSQQEADTIKENLIAAYTQEGSVIRESGFVEDFTITKKYVDYEEIITMDKAYEKLNSTYDSDSTYIVKSGDNMLKIAIEYNTTVKDLCQLNGIPEENAGKISIGQELIVVVAKPLLSVRTVEEITYPEVIQPETIYQNNVNQPKSYSKMIQQGREGEAKVTALITRINGFEVGERIVDDRVVITAAVDNIVEVGTK